MTETSPSKKTFDWYNFTLHGTVAVLAVLVFFLSAENRSLKAAPAGASGTELETGDVLPVAQVHELDGTEAELWVGLRKLLQRRERE